jgi:hypothetical protein
MYKIFSISGHLKDKYVLGISKDKEGERQVFSPK